MRLWPKHWHAETWICSIAGHATPAAHAAVVRPTDAALGGVLPDGRHLARCLRCDAWIEHAPPVGAAVRYDELPSLDQIDKPRRGKALSDAIFMRVIAVNKALHAFAFTVLAIGLVLFRSNLSAVQRVADRLLNVVRGPLGQTGQESSRTWLVRQLDRVLHLQGRSLALPIVLATVYAVVEWTESVGLWKEKVWAEYLTVLATAGFLPLELHELLKRVTVVRVGAFVINVALIAWLVWNKRLFGVRGGHEAIYEHTDWNAILAAPRTARGKVASFEVD